MPNTNTVRQAKKICVLTGATGFFGQACLPYFQKHDCKVLAIYCKNKPKNLTVKNVTFCRLDLFDDAKRLKFFEQYQPTHLLHLAWDVPPGEFWESRKNLSWLNVTSNLFQEFCALGGERFVGVGTLAEYEPADTHPNEGNSYLYPETLYGQCKKSTFEILNQLEKRYKHVNFSWARVGHFFGEHEPKEKLISNLIQKIKSGIPLSLVDQDTTRCYAHVRYLGAALTKLLFDAQVNGPINISSPYPVKMKAIVSFLMEHIKKKVKVSYNDYGLETKAPKILIPSIERQKNELGFDFPDTFLQDLLEQIEGC